jgi:hypothetical protein
MKHLHTRTRRLVITVLFVSAVGLAATLAVSGYSANASRSATPGTVSFYKQGKLLGSIAVSGGLDVVWKTPVCSNGYASPPAAFTWTDAATGLVSAPVMGPCGHAPGSASFIGADDFRCELWPWYAETRCFWTYKKGSGATTSSAKIVNPGNATVGNLYLFKRTALYAYLTSPGKPDKKISVPAGADSMTFAQGS